MKRYEYALIMGTLFSIWYNVATHEYLKKWLIVGVFFWLVFAIVEGFFMRGDRR